MMTSQQRTFRSILFGLAFLVGGSLFYGCGEDAAPVDPPKDFGFSPVTFFHANPGRDKEIIFFKGDTAEVSSTKPTYGMSLVSTVPNGENVGYSVKSLTGTKLASTTGAHDSTQKTMVVFSGNDTVSDLFIATSKKISAAGSSVAVRFIHAANDASPRSLKIGSATGSPIASNVSYKGTNGSYVSVNAATDTLWIVDETNGANSFAVPVNLTVGKVWSIVFHGTNAALSPEFKWKGTPVAEDN